MRAVLILLASLVTLASSPLAAQLAPGAAEQLLRPGVRVRIPGLSRIPGTVRTVTRDTLVVGFPTDLSPRTIARTNIRALEVRVSRDRHWEEGIIVGVLTGVAMAVATARAYAGDCGDCDYVGLAAFVGTIVFVPTFGGAGLLIGFLITTDRWVALDPHPATAVLPLIAAEGQGVRLGMSVRLP